MNNFFDTSKTIVAIATPIGAGGVSIVRMSGKDAINIADKLFRAPKNIKPSNFSSRELVFGTFSGKNAHDNCLCVVFRNPNSFTGDNVVEFQCHGGVKITQLILKDCLENGAIMARNGEFSMRAFLNGKMSLSEAEGMIDLINAESESEVNASYNLMSGSLTKSVDLYQKELVDILGEVEVSFDYPEEDIEYATSKIIKHRLSVLNNNIASLINSSKTGSLIKNGINAVIIGRPNVGKSSLLNALLNKEKAIVTNIAGTTRDVIEDAFEIKGVKVNIIDTAGIHETKDKIEKIGVNKSIEYIKKADIILFVIDNSEDLTKEDKDILSLIKNKKHIIICNKSDKKTSFDYKNLGKNTIKVSAKKNLGIIELKNCIYDMVIDKNIISNNIIITSQRHSECLKNAYKFIDSAINNIDNDTLDLISIDINSAFLALGEITGTTSNEVILDSIFSKFCLGK